MMNLLVLSLLLLSNLAFGKTRLVFNEVYKNTNKVIYESSHFNKPECAESFNCKFFIGHISDSFIIEVNNETLRPDYAGST